MLRALVLLARAVAAALLLLPSLLFGQGGADGARLREAGRAAGGYHAQHRHAEHHLARQRHAQHGHAQHGRALHRSRQHPPAQAEAPPGRPAP